MMKKILVIGCPGSGKTTLSRRLHEQIGLPLYHLDAIWHRADRTHLSREEFDARLGEILARDAWIVDGNYSRTLERRLAACDTVILLDLPTEVCLAGAIERLGTKRPDLPWIDTELDGRLKNEIEQFSTQKLPDIYALLERYGKAKTVLILHSREEAASFCRKMQESRLRAGKTIQTEVSREMNWEKELFMSEEEKPLDRLVEGYSNTGIFRTIGFIGDSLSSGEFESRDAEGKHGYHDYFEYSWGQYIARRNGLKGYNFSRGGMTAREYMTSFAEKKGYWNPELACQAYVLALGVNDVMNTGTPIGSVADIDPENWRNNKPTFVGEYAQIVARIKEEIRPDAKFFFVTMMRHAGDTAEKAEKRQKHAEALYALAEHFDNAYVIDLHQYGPELNERFRESFSLYNHLNPMGYTLVAKMIDSYIDYLIRRHPQDFSRVPYIGTNLK